MTHICIYRQQQFETASGEHILQNSMGARWQSNTIVCDEVQRDFATTIDTALEKGFQEFRLLLGSTAAAAATPNRYASKLRPERMFCLCPAARLGLLIR